MRLACTDDSFSSGAAPRPLMLRPTPSAGAHVSDTGAGGAAARSPIGAQETPTRSSARTHLEGGGEARSLRLHRGGEGLAALILAAGQHAGAPLGLKTQWIET